MRILGLDVSTSCTGVCSVDEHGVVLSLSHIDFKKCNTFWDKVDDIKLALTTIVKEHGPFDCVGVEEPLMGFQPGQSSAQTISLLMKFNGLCSYFIRDLTNKDPTMISSAHARKLCGMKIQRKSVCGKNGKEQAFDFCINGPLKMFENIFPKTKTGKYKPFVFDEVDAFVIANATRIMHCTNVK